MFAQDEFGGCHGILVPMFHMCMHVCASPHVVQCIHVRRSESGLHMNAFIYPHTSVYVVLIILSAPTLTLDTVVDDVKNHHTITLSTCLHTESVVGRCSVR